MSTKYPGGIITKNYTAPTPTSASGIWTLEQQEQAQQAGIWPYGGPFNYIEDVFSTYLWTGTGATNTITNNINLSTYGGLVWVKSRSSGTGFQNWTDTARGATKDIFSNDVSAQGTSAQGVNAFSTTGFTVGTQADYNGSGASMASWTFRKQPKFFDIVTYTGDGTVSRAINHNLGSVPGCIVVKAYSGGVSSTQNWPVYHRSLNGGVNPEQYAAYLNLTNDGTGGGRWANTAPTSTQFYVNNDTTVNQNGTLYVAYIFAHNAGGFGPSNTDNVISCGLATVGADTNAYVTLGYEPQWILAKKVNTTGGWYVVDTMRGLPGGAAGVSNDQLLQAQATTAETTANIATINATGFSLDGWTNGNQFIYIAVRRGPMKVPTDATKVFAPATFTGVDALQTSNFPVDFLFEGQNLAGTIQWYWMDRLRGKSAFLESNKTSAESAQSGGIFDSSTQARASDDANNYKRSYEMFQRAPSFLDVVCYTGVSPTYLTINHNLGVAPELIITKSRSSGVYDWDVGVNFGASTYTRLYLNLTSAGSTTTYPTVFGAKPTSTTYQVTSNNLVNANGATFVAYLFATCAGVSKVGSYTGTGTLTTINCGFTGGARFVLIKRTDSVSNWFVWDTARGMVAGTDPSLSLNASTAEANANSVYTIATGFQLLASPVADVNTNGGTYIYLAIA